MKEYIDLYNEQLEKLPDSGYKTQLVKHGEVVASEILKKSIMNIIANIEITDKDIKYTLPESDLMFKKVMIKPSTVKLSYDLGVCEELIYRLPPDASKVKKAIKKASSDINNHLLQYILVHDFNTIRLPLESILEKRNNLRVLLVGNVTIPNLGIKPDSTSLEYARSLENGDLIFHSYYIPVNTVYAIEVASNDKAIDYLVKHPLSVINNEFVHVSGIRLAKPELITRYLI